jgi:PelA/Pel-15E family pectate lyase
MAVAWTIGGGQDQSMRLAIHSTGEAIMRTFWSMRNALCGGLAMLLALLGFDAGMAQAEASADAARNAMHRAVQFFRENCSAGGGYVYRVSDDLTKREGEEKVGATTAWIQPPGTPAVGMAYLEAFRLTGDPLLKEAALEVSDALIRGQLESGGWDNQMEFDPDERRKHAYRVDARSASENRRRSNTTTFDDNKSQSALAFLMQLDKELKFENERLHEAALYAADSFVKAQYANGAWPQRYSEFPSPEGHRPRQASYPESWPRAYPGVKYAGFYTLNDGTMRDLIATMLDAADIYGDERYRQAAARGGEFFLLAQMPDPQPGWAQQYDQEMHPAWARKFEPPAITGGESQGVMQALILLYRRTGDRKFVEPLPKALAYYRKLLLPEGGLARFYELETDRPLYFTREYELVYTDDDLPTHYSFKVSEKLDRIEQDYQKALATPPEKLWSPSTPKPPRMSDSLTKQAERVIETLDERGAWVEEGRMRNYGSDDDTRRVIDSRTFCENLETLAEYIAASQNAAN